MTDDRIEEIKTLLPRGMLADWVRLGSRLVRLLRDQHHPSSHGAVLDRLLTQARDSVVRREERRAGVPLVGYPPDLPITARKDDIVAAIRAHRVVVIAGETGSGKTTQIPKMCLEAGLGIEAMIGCTQPRRVAALSISRRIAEELNAAWGREVGCKIRFDDRSGDRTFIKLMTDGILLAETRGDPLLTEYNAIILDEAHERSLNIDFLLGYLKGLLAKRADLKLIITSATIDTAAFSRAFNNAPVIEVSGRVYPVEVVYAPLEDAAGEESGMDYLEAAARATEGALCEPGLGDVLVFLPGERDIRDLCDLLEGRLGTQAEIIPLFGGLSTGDQQRVFVESSRRKIVVATNIAETSLTIPGIRFVIDSGLARISRYSPRARIKRLPIEPVSQSSANQRKGRAGRVRSGVCIRLYSEEDFAARPAQTQPEIQRANLAEVILRMKAFQLGEIETFPFLDPPSGAAIQAGYALLRELGALDDKGMVTPLGFDLARLPIDPTLGRMLLQSERENAARELLIIAAGLGIQDPRDRPLEQREAADAAHKRFLDPSSDFLALLNIWNVVDAEWEALRTQSRRRAFCKTRFLSYIRLREWRELHGQLRQALEDLGVVHVNTKAASYEAIHRSILAGLLGYVGKRKERNLYEGAGKRLLALFPGSALHDKAEPPKRGPRPTAPGPKPAAAGQPEWMVAGELVETSRTFARTVAGIEPEWIVELAPHLCTVTHSDPHWSAGAGSVLIREKLSLYGLEVHNRTAAYGNINPKEATEIFIRSALVEEDVLPAPRPNRSEESNSAPSGVDSHPPVGRRSVGAVTPLNPNASKSQTLATAAAPAGERDLPVRYAFLAHNRKIRLKIENWQTRARQHGLGSVDDALFDFYADRIEKVSSLHELNRLLGGHPEEGFLHATEADLAGGEELTYDAGAFPDTIPLGGQFASLAYAYSPGEDQDGVTIRLTPAQAGTVPPSVLEWAVPGLREAQITELLRGLPKAIRRELMPLPSKVAEIVRGLTPSGPTLRHDLSRFIHQHYGLEVTPASWAADVLPNHLRPRIEIAGDDRKTLASGRDLDRLRQELAKVKIAPPVENPGWIRAAQTWERFGLTGWTFGDPPERLVVGGAGGEPLYGWPGLKAEEEAVHLRLFRDPDTARRASEGGFRALIEIALQKDLAWLQKDLRALAKLDASGLASGEELQAQALAHLKRHLLFFATFTALTESCFLAALGEVRARLPGLAAQLTGRVGAALLQRQELLRRAGPAPAGAPRSLSALSQLGAPVAARRGLILPPGELESLMPKNFLEAVPFDRLPHLPRYLKALLMRAERAGMNPLKDQDRVRQLAPYLAQLTVLRARPFQSAAARARVEEFRWIIEEFKVSLFAQELGTAAPVSAKRLDQELDRLRREG